jgi:hypothetical protein
MPLGETVATDKPVREAALFGLHGGHAKVTDGRYVYMCASATEDNQPLFNNTWRPIPHRRPSPSRMRPSREGWFSFWSA